MRVVSAALRAAIEAHERVVKNVFSIDWDNDGYDPISNIDDMSHKIGDIGVTQSLESSLPQSVRVVPGAAVAQLNAKLERGNAFRYDVASTYQSVSSNSSDSTYAVLDTFSRITASGWGTADTGGVYTVSGGSAANYSTTGTLGRQQNNSVGVARNSLLPFLVLDGEFTATVTVSATPTGAAAETVVVGRWTDSNNFVGARVFFNTGGSASVNVVEIIAGVATTSAFVTFSHVALTAVRVKILMNGTLLQAKAWDVNVAEPAYPQASLLSAGTLPAGQIGLRSLLNAGNTNAGGLNIDWDNYSVIFSGTVISVPKPAGLLPGEIVLVGIFYVGSISPLTLPGGTNVQWASLGYRTDGSISDRFIGHLLTRRADATDMALSSYTFQGSIRVNWQAFAVRIGDPGLMGISDVSAKGVDDNITPVVILSGLPVDVKIPNSTIVSFFSVSIPVTGVAATGWTTLDGDTEVADSGIAVTNGSNGLRSAVTIASNVPVGTYIKRAQLTSTGNVYASLQFTVVLAPKLAGNEAQHAAWTFSELNSSSPYAGKLRLGRRTKWDVGFFTDLGFEQVPIFTGLSITSAIASRQRSASFTALDNRETMHETTQAVVNIAENPIIFDTINNQPLYPGLEATWFVSYLITRALTHTGTSGITDPAQMGIYSDVGYFAMPSLRHSTFLWAPMHGSLEAFEGTAYWAYTNDVFSEKRAVRFTDGPFVAGTEPAPSLGGSITAGWSGTSAGQFNDTFGQTAARIELWAKSPTVSGSTLSVTAQDDLFSPQSYATLRILGTGQLTLELHSVLPVTRTINGPTMPQDAAWHFIGVHWDSRTGKVRFRVDNTNTDSTFTIWANATTSQGGLNNVLMALTNGMQIAELMVSGGIVNPSFNQDVVQPTDTWKNENFVPTAYIDKSDNLLISTPFIAGSDETWDILSEIANAEFAAIYFDADGYPHYRTARSDVDTTGQVVSQVVSSRTQLKDLAYSSGLAQIANQVSVGYEPMIPVINGVAYKPNGVLRIPQNGVVKFSIEMPGPIITTGGFNVFNENTNADGTGTVTTGKVIGSVFVNGVYTMEITFTNISGRDRYLVDATGQPTPILTASWMAPTSESIAPVVKEDGESIRKYRVQSLAVSSTKWVQKSDIAAMLALKLLSDLAEPHPTLSDVPVKGDPRRELGDLSTVQDINGIGVNGLYRITGMDHNSSPSDGFEQNLTLREAAVVAYWDLNFWDDGTVWGI
jgi:hypothetical protein